MWPEHPDDATRWLRQRLAAPSARAPFVRPPGLGPGPLTPAAVLVPLIWHPAEPTVLLTRRALSLPTHAGQISFPGGKIEAGDGDAVAGALREAREEVGVEPAEVCVVGRLADYATVTGFLVTPVVGLLVPPVALTPQPSEVDSVFELPLACAAAPGAFVAERYERGGVQGEYWVLHHGGDRVWGATAAMLRALVEALGGSGP
ncbi:NUDIX domain-containing protein [Crenobacter luteus]|uniref:CoA pyrophosphatase n=1 Tax=Crenobacter luteus TaxID=1452487 RepID=UPI0010481625|nr:CoA pyrophosphatase [Crenobacter luteus]TCP14485.1 NUDIX domain-containing protein [Crenobacter luteus]